MNSTNNKTNQVNATNTTNSTTIKISEYDAGLRAYMLQIFNHMAIALVITGLVSYLAGNSKGLFSLMYVQAGSSIKLSYIGWVIEFAPLVMVLFLSSQIRKISAQAAQIIFWFYSALIGISLAPVFLIYTGESIARAFFISASVFGTMSIYGYTTKKDLTSLGSLLLMGVIGILLASLANLFMASSAILFAISVVGVIVFTGLTAYDVKTLKNIYLQSAGLNNQIIAKVAIHGALRLYLDFINLFVMFLNLSGSKKR